MPSAKPTPTRAGQSSSNARSPKDDASPELISWGSKVACGTKKFRFLRKRTISASTSAVVDHRSRKSLCRTSGRRCHAGSHGATGDAPAAAPLCRYSYELHGVVDCSGVDGAAVVQPG